MTKRDYTFDDACKLTLQEALEELYDMGDSEFWAHPVDAIDDIYLAIRYDYDMDEFVDVFGCPIFRESWVQEHELWIIANLI